MLPQVEWGDTHKIPWEMRDHSRKDHAPVRGLDHPAIISGEVTHRSVKSSGGDDFRVETDIPALFGGLGNL